MTRNFVNIVIVAAVLFIVIGCVCPAGRNKGTTPEAPTPKPSSTQASNSASSTGKTSPNKDEGDFKAEHGSVKSSKFDELQKQVKEEKLLEDAAAQLNKALALPDNITLRAEECGEVNAFYDGNEPAITMCYELMEHFYLTFRSTGLSEDKA